MKNKLCGLMLLNLTFLPVLTYAHGSSASVASLDLSSQGLAQIVSGSSQIIAGGSELAIASVKTAGDITYITLKNIHNSTTATVRVASRAVGQASIASGQMVTAVSTASGQLLYAAGKMIAFIPNELGKSLLYSQII